MENLLQLLPLLHMSTHADHRLVGLTASVVKSMTRPSAPAKTNSWARHQIANLSAWSTRSVLRIEHATRTNATIPVLEPVESAHSAELLITIHYAAVQLERLVIHSPDAKNKVSFFEIGFRSPSNHLRKNKK